MIGPDGRNWHIDHVYPKALGGDDGLDNRVLACATCNLSKKHKSANAFFIAKLEALQNLSPTEPESLVTGAEPATGQ